MKRTTIYCIHKPQLERYCTDEKNENGLVVHQERWQVYCGRCDATWPENRPQPEIAIAYVKP